MHMCMGCMEQFEDNLRACPYCGYARETPPREGFHMPPENIIYMTKNGEDKLLDFGAARYESAANSMSLSLILNASGAVRFGDGRVGQTA